MKSFKGFIFVAFLVSLLFFSHDVPAEMKSGVFSLSPYIGGYVFDDDQDIDNGLVYGLGFGYNYTEHFGVEAVFNHIDTELENSDENVDGSIFRIDGLYHFMPEKKFVPYIALGAGAITIDPDRGGSDTDPLVNYGAGIKYFLTKNLALRGDIRHIIPFEDGTNLAYTFGLTYLFGGKVEPVPVPAPPLDSDGDGVIDDMDQCPGTPKGIKVDDKGCPVPIKEKVSIELKVEFDFDKAEIRTIYHEHLQKVANFLKAYPDTEAVIEGHTDSIGTEEYNLKLSQRRADNVRKYLIDNYDIPDQRISAKGFGESMPIADNKTKEGRQRNRRVVGVISTVITK